MEEISVTQAATLLGKTDRTIRNYIKEGRIKARRVENQFGWEYRVYDLGELAPPEKAPAATAEKPPATPENRGPVETALQYVSQENQRLWEENRQLREVNNRLAYDLGGRDEKIRELEQSLENARKMLPAPAGSTSRTSDTHQPENAGHQGSNDGLLDAGAGRDSGTFGNAGSKETAGLSGNPAGENARPENLFAPADEVGPSGDPAGHGAENVTVPVRAKPRKTWWQRIFRR